MVFDKKKEKSFSTIRWKLELEQFALINAKRWSFNRLFNPLNSSRLLFPLLEQCFPDAPEPSHTFPHRFRISLHSSY